MDPKKLQSKGVDLLVNAVGNNKNKDRCIKLIREKFRNISGKTGAYDVPKKLFQNRTARYNRALISFKDIEDNNITYEQLNNTFSNGVVVDFTNNDFFEQLSLDEKNQNSVFKKLKDKLGCNDNVSAIIDIKSTGDPSSKIQEEALKNVHNYLKSINKTENDVLIKKINSKKPTGILNDRWKGFLFYSIRGGSQISKESHDKGITLFNPAVEYANEEVSVDITLVLLYFALFSINEEQRHDNWYNLVSKFEDYLETREYERINLKDYVKKHISLNIKKNQLYDPIQMTPIHVEDFGKERLQDSNDVLDISHNDSVNNHHFIYDKKLNILLSPARPTNLFWSRHLSNMMQQDFTLDQYFKVQEENLNKWQNYKKRIIN